MGIFSGLEKLGLGNIGKEELFEDPKKKQSNVKKEAPVKKLQLVNEEDYLFDKKYKCPVCESDFEAKTVRTGKVRMKNVDIDLRPDYDELDQNKYDVIACPACGYAVAPGGRRKGSYGARGFLGLGSSGKSSFGSSNNNTKNYDGSLPIWMYVLVVAVLIACVIGLYSCL